MPNLNIDGNFFSEGEKVRAEETELLQGRFTEEEIKKAVVESYSNGASCPDGLSFMLYQKFWELVKDDLLAMFEDFYKGGLDLYRLNFALITVIPK
jgi:hypothetical protein